MVILNRRNLDYYSFVSIISAGKVEYPQSLAHSVLRASTTMNRYLRAFVRRIGRPMRRIGKNAVKSTVGQAVLNSDLVQMILDPLCTYQGRRTLRETNFIRGLGQNNIPNPVGRCLVSYNLWFINYLRQQPEIGMTGWDSRTLPSAMEYHSSKFSMHTMHWESAEIVRQLIGRGFLVDCIYGRNGYLVKDASGYDVIIDEWNNLPGWDLQNPKARKLHYATGCHWIFHNEAELTRHRWLFARRGVTVPTVRQVPPILGQREAHLISSFGNRSSASSFGCYASKVRKLWISAVNTPDFKPKDWKSAKSRFLWFGGAGMVHKGLDLVIEAFLLEPQFELIICGGDEEERKMLWSIYGTEIAKADNITYRGFLDPLGKEFQKIVASTCTVVYPSAAEGCSGGIVQCLHHGLIPLVTSVTGLEVHDVWPSLSGENDHFLIDDIRHRCQAIAQMSDKQLSECSYFFWEYAHKNHTRQAYCQSLSDLLDEFLGD